MITIHKFRLHDVCAVTVLSLPQDAIPRCVGVQELSDGKGNTSSHFMLWCELDTEASRIDRYFKVYETGQRHDLKYMSEQYIGTIQELHDGDPSVHHVYELINVRQFMPHPASLEFRCQRSE